jgi:hypothetical protein
MKKIFAFLTLVYVSALYAQSSPSFLVLERKARSNGTFFHRVELEDLISADRFEGEYFKIVKGKSLQAISFTEKDSELILKAATAYHHLTKAKNYWEKVMDSKRPEELQQIIVRLEIINLFDEQGHFAHENRSPQYNNALSIPAGETPEWVPAERQDKWANEIWFRPMKKIDTRNLPGLGTNPLTSSLQSLEQPFINYTVNRFNTSIMEHIFYPSYAPNPLWVTVVRFAGTIALTKAVIEASKHMDNLFAEKYYYLDTAMVPEVMYHEYAHLMLSDYLTLSHSTPVIEGMADYFAAILTDKRKIYARVKGYSNAALKDTEQKRNYSHWYESNRMATSDFVLSVLWDVRETLGSEIADKLVYEMRTSLKTGSATINHHLLQAVLDACDVKCESSRRDKLKLYQTFVSKGF